MARPLNATLSNMTTFNGTVEGSATRNACGDTGDVQKVVIMVIIRAKYIIFQIACDFRRN